MKYVDYDKLPVEIKDNTLPKDEDKHYKMFYDERVRTSGGFADALFLAGILGTGFVWGMLTMIIR